MDDTYKTLQEPSHGQFKDRGSKFLAYAYPVESQEQIKDYLADLRKEHHGARHHAYAYRIGPGLDNYRANDDGEPANSSGKPILGQIDSFGLSNILIVVVRYFGGVLLGVGGLINAYRSAAREAILAGEIIERYFLTAITLNFPYSAMSEVMRLMKEFQAELLVQDFQEKCSLVLRIRSAMAETLTTRLRRFESVEVERNGL